MVFRLLISFFLFFVSIPLTSHAQSKGNINVLLGQKNMDKWKGKFSELPLFAVELDYVRPGWPVRLLFGISGATNDDNILSGGYIVKVEGSTSELYIGARKYFNENSRFRPYVSGGLSFVQAEIKGSISLVSINDTDSAIGLLLNGGAVYKFNSFNVGLDFKALTGADVELLGVSTNANYGQFALILGYSW